MLSAEAYSFRLKSRLAISLSWIAGYTNVASFLTCDEVLSHQTGNSTHLGQALAGMMLRESGAWHHAFYFAFLVGSFFFGAICSAFMTEGARRSGRASKYILPMSVEGILLSILTLLLVIHPIPKNDSPSVLWMVTGIASFAMGLQNATITKISGAVVRTTHLTGVITDLGLESVQFFLWWRDQILARKAGRIARAFRVSRRHPSALRLALLASIFGSFLFGATLGGILYTTFAAPAMLVPVLFLLWIVMVDYLTPIADVREIDPTRDQELISQVGNLKSLLPPDVGIFRVSHHKAGRKHHAPDFSGLIGRIPKNWKVIILVISPLTQFDPDTATGLLAALRELRNHNRTLVISGMNRSQFKTLINSDISNVIDLDNFVPDLEFAVARGINLAEMA